MRAHAEIRNIPIEIAEKKNHFIFRREGEYFFFDAKNVYLWKISRKTYQEFKNKGVAQYAALAPVNPMPCHQHDFEHDIITKYDPNNPGRPYIILNLTHACNLACTYCFASGGHYNGPANSIHHGTIHDAIDLVCQTFSAKTIDIKLFGGEPMLNLSGLRDALSYSRDQGRRHGIVFNYFMTTNGTVDFRMLLDEITEYKIFITVSFDGSRDVHDRNRPFKVKRCSSYDVLVANVQNFIRAIGPEQLAAKVTIAKGEHPSLKLIKKVLNVGFKNVILSHEMPGGCSNPETRAVDAYDYAETLKHYDEIAGWYVKRLNAGDEIQIQPFIQVMKHILRSQFISAHCHAGTNLLAIAADGTVYPCHRFVGNKQFALGSVCGSSGQHLIQLDVKNKNQSTTVKLNTQIGKHFREKQLQSITQCSACWARSLCFGNRCPYQNVLYDKPLEQLNNPDHCDYIRGFLEMMFYHSSHIKEKNRFAMDLMRRF